MDWTIVGARRQCGARVECPLSKAVSAANEGETVDGRESAEQVTGTRYDQQQLRAYDYADVAIVVGMGKEREFGKGGVSWAYQERNTFMARLLQATTLGR